MTSPYTMQTVSAGKCNVGLWPLYKLGNTAQKLGR